MKKKITIGKYEIELDKIENEHISIKINHNGKYETFLINEKSANKLYETLIAEKWSQMENTFFTVIEDENPFLDIEVRLDTLNLLNSVKLIKRDKITADVYIALPQKKIDLKVIENIQNCCGDIMEALDYELEQKEEPVFGSFFQKLKFKLISPKTGAEIENGFDKAKQALEAKYVKLPSAESTEKLANSTANLIIALKDIDEGVLRLGSLLLVKHSVDGKSKVYSETLSPKLSTFLDENPQMLKDPNTVYLMLQTLKSSPNLFREIDEVNSAIID